MKVVGRIAWSMDGRGPDIEDGCWRQICGCVDFDTALRSVMGYEMWGAAGMPPVAMAVTTSLLVLFEEAAT